jgi:prevent-host-death family protein
MKRSAVSVAVLRAKLSQVIDEVRAGGEVVVVRSGKPVARIVKVDDDAALRAAGLRPARRAGRIPDVRPVKSAHGSVTARVLEDRG